MDVAFEILQRKQKYVTIWLHTGNDPSAIEWDEACARLNEFKSKTPDFMERMVMIALTDGGAPNQKQRAQLFGQVFEKKPVKSVGVTSMLETRLMRGLAMAIGWINPAFKAFRPSEFADALKHIGFEGDFALLTEFAELQKKLGKPVGTLATILEKKS